ncbi:MAG: transglycosylase SLT domain-containing protein [Chloroflexota bacterium]|nr:transglycosylase SLT domain-containing protein [Chloroflexota bacterium]
MRLSGRRLRGGLLGLLIGLASIAATISLSSEPAQAAPTSCRYSGGGPPFSLQSFEAHESRQTYLETLRLAAANRLFPGDEDFELPALSAGRLRSADASATIPPQILYAIAWVESKIAQAAYEVDWGTLGPPKLSFDCGYGIMQITSTIVNDGGLPSRYEALVGTHFAYNIAAGARILAEKWNEDYFPVVGESDPRYVESWYFALWAYNGWAWINHPGNPDYDPARRPYDCNADMSGYWDYPYQERVLGCVINPPVVGGQRLWEPHPVILPEVGRLTMPGGALDPDLFLQTVDQIRERMSLDLPANALAAEFSGGNFNPDRGALLGTPLLDGLPSELELSSSELSQRGAALTVANDGSGLLAWRVVSTPSWLVVGTQAGVALGSGYGFTNGPEHSVIPISAAAGGVPEGSHRGQIRLEFHYPDGSSETRSVAISLDKRGAAFYKAGRPQS